MNRQEIDYQIFNDYDPATSSSIETGITLDVAIEQLRKMATRISCLERALEHKDDQFMQMRVALDELRDAN